MIDTITAKNWLGGFTDGEGHINLASYSVEIGNTDFELMDYAMECLATLGIDYCKYIAKRKPPHKHIMLLRITRKENMLKFIDNVNIAAPEKREKLNTLREYFTHRERCSWDEPFTKEEITTLRDKGYSVKRIAEYLNCSYSCIARYMHKYGLPLQSYRRGNPPSPEEIRYFYWEKGMSIRELSAKFGYRTTCIVKVMKRDGIPRRKAGRYNR